MVFLAKQKLLLVTLFSALFIGVIILLYVTLGSKDEQDVHHKAAVVTNGIECAGIASEILKKGGSAADAAVTALLCEGVTCPQSTGLGGGFFMTIFTKATNKTEVLTAREVAPLLSSETMFENVEQVNGGKAIAVPGELKGMWELHQKYGKLKWAQLFEPVIKLCRKGHIVSRYLANIFTKRKHIILASSTLSEIYIDPITNDTYKVGQLIKRPVLADTLELISKEGADTLYNNGTLAQQIVQDIQKEGGIVSIDDFLKYEVRWESPLTIQLKNNKTLHSFPLPGSGPLLLFILNVLNNYLPDGVSLRTMQRITETFKYAYAMRMELGDGKYVKEAIDAGNNLTDIAYAMYIRSKLNDVRTSNDYRDYGTQFYTKDDHGTAHINILAENGDAIAITSSINSIFGSKIRSRQTGIILNDSMDDFSNPGKKNGYGLPPSPNNFIAPGKIPLSSMAPTILLDEHNNVEFMIGAAGGTKITTSIAYVLLRYLQFNESVWDAVHAPRIHHQLLPMRIEYEQGFPDEFIQGLHNFGHEMFKQPADIGFASLTAIGRDKKKLVAVYDPRRLGSTSVY